MNRIKAFVGYNDVNNFHYYQNFRVVEELPKINDIIDYRKVVSINPVSLDCDQPNYTVYDYDFFTLTLLGQDDDFDIISDCICIKKD